MQMLKKTKAALQGRQWVHSKQNQHTRPAAGGQSQSAPAITGTAPLPQLGFLAQDFRQWRGYTALQYTPKVISPKLGRSRVAYLQHGQPLGSSLACLRCRRLISPSIAVTINWAVLSPDSFTCSIASITSCGARACTFCDFSFFVPVAITDSPPYRWSTVYPRKREIKHLKWNPLCIYSGVHLELKAQIKAKPGSASTLTGPLTKPLCEVTVMADQQHTQTHPKFTWLFLATPAGDADTCPVIVRFNADTEETARGAFPGWDLIFAAKIRAQPPCRVTFFDYTTRRGWEFDSAAVQEVRHA